jgi:2-desacetyl-2-hydroxyethyl bacteriochlorophyllide A dehydrogenase
MNTIVLEQPGRLVATHRLNAEALQDNEALARVKRVGICGTDLHAFKGDQPFFSYPRVLGHELGVEVIAVGGNHAGLQPGDRCAVEPYLHCGACVACRRGKSNCCARLQVLGVHADGGLTETLIVPINKLHKSDHLSLEQLALVEPLSIGAHAVARAEPERDEFALVVGVGPIGLAVIQFAQLAGARVIALDVNEGRLDFAVEHFGVEHAVKAGDDALDLINGMTDGEMPVTVFDATGNKRSVEASFNLVAHGGKLALVGLFEGEVTFKDSDAHRRELTLLRCRNATGADFQRVIGHLEAGEIDVNPWITHRVTFAEAITQFTRWLNPQSRFIKAVVEVS